MTPVNNRVSVCAVTVCSIIRLSDNFTSNWKGMVLLRALLKPARVGKGREEILPHRVFIQSY